MGSIIISRECYDILMSNDKRYHETIDYERLMKDIESAEEILYGINNRQYEKIIEIYNEVWRDIIERIKHSRN